MSVMQIPRPNGPTTTDTGHTRILHVLSQRPGRTGSGITLEALVRGAASRGYDQRVVIGVPAGGATPTVGDLDSSQIYPLRFETPELPFALPGMSDVMPYPSTRFQDMPPRQLTLYRDAWCQHLRPLLAEFQPDLIHSHHVWLLSSWLKELAPETPIVTHCHATGLRQRELCPHLAADVSRGCARNEHFVVLHRGHCAALKAALGVADSRITAIGAGYREQLFFRDSTVTRTRQTLLYAGKFSFAKGLHCLLDTAVTLRRRFPRLVLHVAGDGAGSEAEHLRQRMRAMSPAVVMHGMLPQAQLAQLMRRCELFVLPSFYEGLPLVLVEAIASGMRAVCTDLPGVATEIAPALGAALVLVPLPTLLSVDEPAPQALPGFIEALADGITEQLDSAGALEPPPGLADFTWSAVLGRVDRIWRALATRPQH